MVETVRSVAYDNQPCYIRFGKGGEPEIPQLVLEKYEWPFKQFGLVGSSRVIITTGIALHVCLEAQKALLVNGIHVLVLHFPKLNDSSFVGLNDFIKDKERIVVVEEHQERGGLLTQILHYSFNMKMNTKEISHISLGNEFIRKYGSQSDHLSNFGISVTNIVDLLIKKD
jgi:transketolase